MTNLVIQAPAYVIPNAFKEFLPQPSTMNQNYVYTMTRGSRIFYIEVPSDLSLIGYEHRNNLVLGSPRNTTCPC